MWRKGEAIVRQKTEFLDGFSSTLCIIKFNVEKKTDKIQKWQIFKIVCICMVV